MSWAKHAIEKLGLGQTVVICLLGNSMVPLVKSGAKVTIKPNLEPLTIQKGDIVLVRVSGNDYLHLVSSADKARVQISNNKGRINGWVKREKVYGVAISIDNNPASSKS